MHSFVYEGVEYRSLHEFCKEKHVSWQKMRRLCRHYKRAKENPAVAADWVLGKEKLSPGEPKTIFYLQDLERNRDRQEAFRDRAFERVLNT